MTSFGTTGRFSSPLIDYAYNGTHFHSNGDIPDHEKVSDGQHDLYFEAALNAIYRDRGIEYAKSWLFHSMLRSYLTWIGGPYR